MDILSHTLSGVAAVSVTLPFTTFSWKQKLVALGLGAFAGAYPDLDAVSLYSKFGETGKAIYFGKLWFSHHAFNHSILAAILFSTIVFAIRTKGFKNKNKSELLLSICLFVGFCAHLLEDMPTPFCVWGGVRCLFPLPIYVGGTGKIWWWNNYDIFLIILSISMFSLAFHLLFKNKYKAVYILFSICAIGLIFRQINTRIYDYNYKGFSSNYQVLESKSLEEQKELLPPFIYRAMVKMDQLIPLNF